METLNDLAQSNPHWSLEDFVQVTNRLLPQFLPIHRSHTKVRETVTPRLVRHYTSQGMVDEPLKQGKYAVYIYRHLLQILVVRRLLSEGYGATAINNLATTQSNSELQALLEGGIQLTITPANPALGFLQQIKKRRGDPYPKLPVAQTPAPPDYQFKPSSHWQRIEVVPGLELHVRDDFQYPCSPTEEDNLLQCIAAKLLNSVQS